MQLVSPLFLLSCQYIPIASCGIIVKSIRGNQGHISTRCLEATFNNTAAAEIKVYLENIRGALKEGRGIADDAQ